MHNPVAAELIMYPGWHTAHWLEPRQLKQLGTVQGSQLVPLTPLRVNPEAQTKQVLFPLQVIHYRMLHW